MRLPRSSGILLHITSLHGSFGLGDLGNQAMEFVSFLQESGQKVWQVLPLGPPAKGNSPYSCYSAFAGNPLLISPDRMAEDGWLDATELCPPEQTKVDEACVDYNLVAKYKSELLRRAFVRSRGLLTENEKFEIFCQQNAYWLDDFARFESLMRHFAELSWTRWPAGLVHRVESEIAKWDTKLADEIEYSKFQQFVFDQQWTKLKRFANERGVRIFGDMPIFVAHQSADVWANQELFHLDEHGMATHVAGVPPDYFSETGQLWGNPLYRWDVLESSNFAWWTERFGRALKQFDLLRVDHFRGFESYWEVPANSETAVNGRWRAGPCAKPFDVARKKLGELPIVAEDLGMITQEVHDLRDRLGFPAMRVMQFGFDDPNDVFHHPHHYPEHSVAYTGTHDNDTLMGWYEKKNSGDGDNRLLHDFIGADHEVHLRLIQSVLDSKSDTAIVPMQDVLGLGSESRMNVPGEPEGNWRWRIRRDDLSDTLARRLREMTVASRR